MLFLQKLTLNNKMSHNILVFIGGIKFWAFDPLRHQLLLPRSQNYIDEKYINSYNNVTN